MKAASETKRETGQDGRVDWRPTRDVLRGLEDYSKQCCLAGMDSYLDRDCTPAIKLPYQSLGCS